MQSLVLLVGTVYRYILLFGKCSLKQNYILYFGFVCSQNKDSSPSSPSNSTNTTSTAKSKKVLTCGKPVNSTQYDHLRGITNRQDHPHIPEPEVAMIFRKKGSRSSEVDLNELEKKLWNLKKEKPSRRRCTTR